MTFVGIMSDLANFGAAGLMGTMWLWERKLSRRRERQLTETHERIIRDEERLKLLMEVVDHNTGAITRFAETQRQVTEALKDLTRELNHAH
jgi:uncharacterized protein YigA (DUF484 family)